MAGFVALLAVLTWGLLSGRLARYSITLPIVLVVIGAVLSATHVVEVRLDSESVRILVELALSILLFADATENSARWLRSAIERCSCVQTLKPGARHRRSPNRGAAGSDVDRSSAAYSTSTNPRPEPLVTHRGRVLAADRLLKPVPRHDLTASVGMGGPPQPDDGTTGSRADRGWSSRVLAQWTIMSRVRASA